MRRIYIDIFGKHLAFTKLSVNGFLGGLFMMSLSLSSYASEIAGTCYTAKSNTTYATLGKTIYQLKYKTITSISRVKFSCRTKASVWQIILY